MKKIIVFLGLLLLTTRCSNGIVEKPDNLIDRDIMINILYDMSIIEASHSNGYSNGVPPMEADNYILKKYKIDSLQFAKSNKYYASDVKKYKQMFQTVNEKLIEKDIEISKTILIKTGKQVAPATNSN
jgi:hypothetical protein